MKKAKNTPPSKKFYMPSELVGTTRPEQTPVSVQLGHSQIRQIAKAKHGLDLGTRETDAFILLHGAELWQKLTDTAAEFIAGKLAPTA